MGKLGNDKAYIRLNHQIEKNLNKDFGIISNFNFEHLTATAINATIREVKKYQLLKKCTNPNFKITITYGNDDIYQYSMNYVKDRYPTANIITIPQSGHIPWLHNPSEFKNIILSHYG